MATLIPPSLSGKRACNRQPSFKRDCNTPSQEQSGHRASLGILPHVAGIYSPTSVNPEQLLFWQASHSVHRWQSSPVVDLSKEELKHMRDPHTFSICSQLEHDRLPHKFMDVCRRLVQPAPDQSRHYVMCREPCQSYCKEVYGPLTDAGSTRGIFPSYWAYFQVMLYNDQEDPNRFNSDIFTYAFCHALHHISSWGCSNDALCSMAIEGRTFHVYQFIPMLRSHQGHPCLNPSKGLTLQEANDLVYLMLTLFFIFNIGKDLGKCYIKTSELGSWILEWQSVSHFHHGCLDSSPSLCHL